MALREIRKDDLREKERDMGAANALVFLIAVIIGIIVGVAVFYGAMAYTGSGILGFIVSILIAIGGGWLAY